MSQSIKRAFSYNVGSPIAGTSQVGNIAIQAASQDYSQDPGGVKWWSGPIEDSGYVIAYQVPSGNHPTPVLIPGSVNSGGQASWSTTYKATDIALSMGSNQKATQVFSYSQSVLSNTFIPEGQKVMFSINFESTQPNVGVGGRTIGIGRTSMNYSSTFNGYPGNDTNSIGFSDDGKCYYNGSIIVSGLPTWTDGYLIDIAVDLSVGGCWIREGGGLWNNDPGASPVAGTGALSLMGIDTEKIYPVANPYIYGSMTLISTYPYAPPSGFTVLGTNQKASLGFKRSAAKTEGSFIDLANRISGQNFPNGNDAKDWLNTNGYWCSWQTAVGLSVKLGTNTAGICGQNDMTVYTTSGVITPGLTLYFDSGMTTPVTTFTYVQDYYNTTITYHLNSTTGLIGSNSGQSC